MHMTYSVNLEEAFHAHPKHLTLISPFRVGGQLVISIAVGDSVL